ncbi:MAG: hypothetical protein AVDCRST_MAG09-64, partial [uncultured Sphingomonas sp.]
GAGNTEEFRADPAGGAAGAGAGDHRHLRRACGGRAQWVAGARWIPSRPGAAEARARAAGSAARPVEAPFGPARSAQGRSRHGRRAGPPRPRLDPPRRGNRPAGGL